MNKGLKEKGDKLIKSIKSTVKKIKEKDAIKDVLDPDRVAEVGGDSISSSKDSVMNKSKDKKEKKFKKEEVFVKNMIKNFQKISSLYMQKKENDLEKGRMANFGEKKTTELMGEAVKIGKDIKKEPKNKEPKQKKPLDDTKTIETKLAANEDD